MSKALLYISCHSTLEKYDTRIFSELGFDVFSTGFYQNPRLPTSQHLDSIDRDVNESFLQQFKLLNPDYTYGYKIPLKLTKKFVDQFDVVVVSWRFDYLEKNLALFKDKCVVFETVGQSDRNREMKLANVRRRNNVKIVRVSKTEENFSSYAGADAVVGACIDTDLFSGWHGSEETVLTVNSSTQQRSSACKTSLYLLATEGFNRKLYGTHNEGFKVPFNYGKVSFDTLLSEYRKCRVFFGLGSIPAPLTYTTMEAMSVGCPVITWGPVLGNHPIDKTYAMYNYIDNEKSGFYSDDIPSLRNYINKLLRDKELAASISKEGRKKAIEYFSIETVKSNWKAFFTDLGVL